jgi:hypothetical protein
MRGFPRRMPTRFLNCRSRNFSNVAGGVCMRRSKMDALTRTAYAECLPAYLLRPSEEERCGWISMPDVTSARSRRPRLIARWGARRTCRKAAIRSALAGNFRRSSSCQGSSAVGRRCSKSSASARTKPAWRRQRSNRASLRRCFDAIPLWQRIAGTVVRRFCSC